MNTAFGSRRFFICLTGGFLLLQVGFWYETKGIEPRMEIVPSVPGEKTIEAVAFGDKEFLFRSLAINIQTFGDTFGRFSPLYQYDFSKLYNWFLLADSMDKESVMVPTMASYYFSQTQRPKDNIWVVKYLEQYAAGRIAKKWWWQAQAAYIAHHKLQDMDWAIKLALPLKNEQKIPFWARELAGILYEQKGEFQSALEIMEDIKAHADEIPQGELNFMRYFVEERLSALDKAQKNHALKEFPPQKTVTPENTPFIHYDGIGGSQ